MKISTNLSSEVQPISSSLIKRAIEPTDITNKQLRRYLFAQLVSSIVIFVAVFGIVGNLLEYGSSELFHFVAIWIIANLMTVRLVSGRIV